MVDKGRELDKKVYKCLTSANQCPKPAGYVLHMNSQSVLRSTRRFGTLVTNVEGVEVILEPGGKLSNGML